MVEEDKEAEPDGSKVGESGMTDETGSQTFALSDLSANLPKPTKAEKRGWRKQEKAVKSQQKAIKNQERFTIAIRNEDVEKVARVIHGESYDPFKNEAFPLAGDTTIQDVINRNIGYTSAIHNHNQELKRSIAVARKDKKMAQQRRRRSSQNDDADADKQLVATAILLELGIAQSSPGPNIKGHQMTPKASFKIEKSREAIVAKLRTAIMEDIEKWGSDQRNTAARCAGFWRFCGKTVFDRMTQNAREVDWKTGENLRKARTDGEPEGNEEIPAPADGG